MADRYIKPDGLPDNRITCLSCRHARTKIARCAKLNIGIIVDLPLRCVSYRPDHIERDQTPGRERWPGLMDEIRELRGSNTRARHTGGYNGELTTEEEADAAIGRWADGEFGG